ncbi:MAG: hypothetical protein EXR21_06510 [Flavobacteriaceae bacterium]|nr:hypothetical protein [Flavobacteriaceae bacterium]
MTKGGLAGVGGDVESTVVNEKVFRGVGGENINSTYGGISDDGMGIFYTSNKKMAEQFAGTSEYNPDKGEYEKTYVSKLLTMALLVFCSI